MKIIEVDSLVKAQELCNSGFPEQALIFKHSPRCSISVAAWDRFNRHQESLPADFPVFLVNVLTNRDSSLFFAEHFSVEHASPQILLIKNQKCTFDTSHNAIDARFLAEEL